MGASISDFEIDDTRNTNSFFFLTVGPQISFVNSLYKLFEPRHDKKYKVTVRPAKTQISLGIRPV